MPYINTTVTKTLTDADTEALTAAFGRAIEKIPGKTEEWLMLNFEGGSKMAFRGDRTGEYCYLEVSILGSSDRESYNSLVAALTEAVTERLGIAPSNIYVKIEEAELWGWRGELF